MSIFELKINSVVLKVTKSESEINNENLLPTALPKIGKDGQPHRISGQRTHQAVMVKFGQRIKSLKMNAAVDQKADNANISYPSLDLLLWVRVTANRQPVTGEPHESHSAKTS